MASERLSVNLDDCCEREDLGGIATTEFELEEAQYHRLSLTTEYALLPC